MFSQRVNMLNGLQEKIKSTLSEKFNTISFICHKIAQKEMKYLKLIQVLILFAK